MPPVVKESGITLNVHRLLGHEKMGERKSGMGVYRGQREIRQDSKIYTQKKKKLIGGDDLVEKCIF